MKIIVKKGLVIVSIYLIFVLYLFMVSNRIERLDSNSNTKNVGVAINLSK